MAKGAYRGLGIIKTDGKHNFNKIDSHEIKGYSLYSGTFFQGVEQGLDPIKVIDAALDENNIELVKTVFPDKAHDIHKRIVFFSQVENMKLLEDKKV